MAASLDDILTVQKNAVVGLNNLAVEWSKTQARSLPYCGAMPTSAGRLVAATTPGGFVVRDMMIANTTGSGVTFRLFVVPLNGAAAATNAIYYDTTLAANTTFHWEGHLALPFGTSLYGEAPAGVTIAVSGSAL